MPHKIPTHTMIRVSCWKIDISCSIPLDPATEKTHRRESNRSKPTWQGPGECSGAGLKSTTNSTAELSLRFFTHCYLWQVLQANSCNPSFFPLQNSTFSHPFVAICTLLYHILPLDQSSLSYTHIWLVIPSFSTVCIKDGPSLCTGGIESVLTELFFFKRKSAEVTTFVLPCLRGSLRNLYSSFMEHLPGTVSSHYKDRKEN